MYINRLVGTFQRDAGPWITKRQGQRGTLLWLLGNVKKINERKKTHGYLVSGFLFLRKQKFVNDLAFGQCQNSERKDGEKKEEKGINGRAM